MENVIIRQANLADTAIIYEFICGLENERFNEDTFVKCYEMCLGEKNNYYLVATLKDQITGFISCHGQVLLHHVGLVYEIQEMYVHPDYRNRGIGKQMLSALEEWIDKENYVLLEVCSNMKRKDAHRF